MYNVSLETYNIVTGLACYRLDSATDKVTLVASRSGIVVVRRSVGVTGGRIGSIGIIRRVVGRSVRVIVVGRPVRVVIPVRRAIGVVIIGRTVGVIVVVGRPVGVIGGRRAVGVGVGRSIGTVVVVVGRAVGIIVIVGRPMGVALLVSRAIGVIVVRRSVRVVVG